MDYIVQTKNLNKKYKYKHALKKFNITINKGDIYVGYWYDSASSAGCWVNEDLYTPITQ